MKTTLSLIAVLLLAAGCSKPAPDLTADLRRQLNELRTEQIQMKREILTLRLAVDANEQSAGKGIDNASRRLDQLKSHVDTLRLMHGQRLTVLEERR